MKKKSYKNRSYREITTTETPYLNIFTGQRFFIDAEAVPPKNLFYVEDLNPYNRPISIVTDNKERAAVADNIYRLLRHKIETENRCQMLTNAEDYVYPMWFEELLEHMYYRVFE